MNSLVTKIKAIFFISMSHQIGIKEAIEKIKRSKLNKGQLSGKVSLENSPEKEDSPEKQDSPREESSSKKGILEELEESGRKLEELLNEEKVILKIETGRYGPYRITGKGPEYEILFTRIEEPGIPKNELEKLCQENGLNEEEILEICREIGNHMESTEEYFQLMGKGKEKEEEILIKDEKIGEKDYRELFDEEFDENLEKDINTERFDSTSSTVESEILTSETEEEIEIINMALNIAKIEKFLGEDNEDPIEWVKEFKRVAAANAWTDDDNDNTIAFRMAVAHLEGTAANWYENNVATIT